LVLVVSTAGTLFLTDCRQRYVDILSHVIEVRREADASPSDRRLYFGGAKAFENGFIGVGGMPEQHQS